MDYTLARMHNHHNHHGSNHNHTRQLSNLAARRATWNSVGVNILLTIAQLIVGWLGHSQALMADAVHSLSDLFSDFVVLVAARGAAWDADDNHPYGHQRFENAATLLLGVLMLSLGGGMIWTAIARLDDAVHIAVSPWVLVTALITLIAKEVLFRYLLAVGKRLRSSLLVANAWHSRSDALSSLVVVIGVIGSLAGFAIADALATIGVGLMIMWMGWQFSFTAFSDLTDHALEPKEIAAIRAALMAIPGVKDVDGLRTRKMGDDAIMDAHLLVDADLTVSEGHRIAEAARARLLAQHRVLDALLHIDPEHDSHVGRLLDLPEREQILAVLHQAILEAGNATGVGNVTQVQQMLAEKTVRFFLHYVDGAVNVDVLLPKTILPAQQQWVVSGLTANNLSLQHSWLRCVRVFTQN